MNSDPLNEIARLLHPSSSSSSWTSCVKNMMNAVSFTSDLAHLLSYQKGNDFYWIADKTDGVRTIVYVKCLQNTDSNGVKQDGSVCRVAVITGLSKNTPEVVETEFPLPKWSEDLVFVLEGDLVNKVFVAYDCAYFSQGSESESAIVDLPFLNRLHALYTSLSLWNQATGPKKEVTLDENAEPTVTERESPLANTGLPLLTGKFITPCYHADRLFQSYSSQTYHDPMFPHVPQTAFEGMMLTRNDAPYLNLRVLRNAENYPPLVKLKEHNTVDVFITPNKEVRYYEQKEHTKVQELVTVVESELKIGNAGGIFECKLEEGDSKSGITLTLYRDRSRDKSFANSKRVWNNNIKAQRDVRTLVKETIGASQLTPETMLQTFQILCAPWAIRSAQVRNDLSELQQLCCKYTTSSSGGDLELEARVRYDKAIAFLPLVPNGDELGGAHWAWVKILETYLAGDTWTGSRFALQKTCDKEITRESVFHFTDQTEDVRKIETVRTGDVRFMIKRTDTKKIEFPVTSQGTSVNVSVSLERKAKDEVDRLREASVSIVREKIRQRFLCGAAFVDVTLVNTHTSGTSMQRQSHWDWEIEVEWNPTFFETKTWDETMYFRAMEEWMVFTVHLARQIEFYFRYAPLYLAID